MPQKKNWKNVRIPEDSDTYKIILEGGNVPAWQTIEQNIKKQSKTKEEKAIKITHVFFEELIMLYPDKKKKIEIMLPYFIRQIIRNKKIGDDYFDSLRDYDKI